MKKIMRSFLILMVIVCFGSSDVLADDPLTAGKAALEQKNYQKAIELLREATRKDKKNPQAYFWLGVALQQADSLDESVAAFISAREFDSTNAKIYEMLGDTYFKQNIYAAAIGQYQIAAEFDSTNAKYFVKLARACRKARQYNESAIAYMKSLRLDTSDMEVYRELAKLYMDAKQYAIAAPYLKHIVERDPNANAEQLSFVKVLFQIKNYEELIPLAKKVVERDTTQKDILKMLGIAYMKVHDNANAEIVFKKLEQFNLLKAEDYVELAKAQKALDKADDAIASYEKAYQMDSTIDAIYYDLGSLYMKRQQYPEAFKMFDKKINSDTTAGYRFASYLNGGLCLMQMKDFQRAKIYIQKSIEIKPEYIQAWYSLANCYAQMDSNNQKIEAYQKFIELVTAGNGNGSEGKYNKQLEESYRIIGFQYIIDKKFTLSAEYFKKALLLNPKDPQLLLWTAQALQNANNKDEAIKYYKKVLEVTPKGSKIREDAIKGLNLLGVPIFEGE